MPVGFALKYEVCTISCMALLGKTDSLRNAIESVAVLWPWILWGCYVVWVLGNLLS